MSLWGRIKFFLTGVVPERFGEPSEVWIHAGNKWVCVWKRHGGST